MGERQMTEKELMKAHPCIDLVCYYSGSSCLKVCFKNGQIKMFANEQELENYIEENKL